MPYIYSIVFQIVQPYLEVTVGKKVGLCGYIKMTQFDVEQTDIITFKAAINGGDQLIDITEGVSYKTITRPSAFMSLIICGIICS